jgi:hypothetical protein
MRSREMVFVRRRADALRQSWTKRHMYETCADDLVVQSSASYSGAIRAYRPSVSRTRLRAGCGALACGFDS